MIQHCIENLSFFFTEKCKCDLNKVCFCKHPFHFTFHICFSPSEIKRLVRGGAAEVWRWPGARQQFRAENGAAYDPSI